MKTMAVGLAMLLTLLSQAASAYEVKCEPWGNNETRCRIGKAVQEPGVVGRLQITAKASVKFVSTGWYSLCGVSGGKQFDQASELNTGGSINLTYTIADRRENGCFEIFLSQCTVNGNAVDCYRTFNYEWPN